MDAFLLNTPREHVRLWLEQALDGAGTLVTEEGAQEAFVEQIS